MSQTDTTGSRPASHAPSATSMCDQKSPKPRSRFTLRTRSTRRAGSGKSASPADGNPRARQVRHVRDLNAIASPRRGRRERSLAPLGPPATTKRRSRDSTEAHGTVHLQAEQGRPYRDPAHEVDRSVDRVDKPTASTDAGAAHFFTEDGIAWPFVGNKLADRGLGRPVGLSDRARVGFGLDRQGRAAEGRDGRSCRPGRGPAVPVPGRRS